MLRDEAIAIMQIGLGRRTDLFNDCVAALQKAQRLEERKPKLPQFLISEIRTKQSTIGEQRLLLPVDYIRGYEEDALYLYIPEAATEEGEYEWLPLERDDTETLRKMYPGIGEPRAYSEDGKYFRLFPIPQEEYFFKHIFYKKDQVLTSNIENAWLKHAPYLLIGVAGKSVALDIRDTDAVARFAEQEAEERAALFIDTEAAEHANRRYVMGGTD